ncbi:MAG: tRNA (adenosine(37)-N6)-threonylcarbamoyltransferase complex dimerization subunit type 1 TsaB [Gemmatimonadota bacterium]|nr:tRNA (adenosine(37)-N6)-threonylcarbamoyltransferase complex dimerization subunit type 1 TsaB [Gemmatimonadota bacterium]
MTPDSWYLALETSTSAGTVAVARGAEIRGRMVLTERGRHAAHLVPAIADALEQAEIRQDHLAGVILGAGPGSFTGVRVAAATAKALVRVLDVPLWAFSSLAAGAVAEGDGSPFGVRYVLFDARGDRVYGACYAVGVHGVETLIPPHGDTLRDALAGDVPVGSVFVGDGALEHREAIAAAGFSVGAPPLGFPTADSLVRLLALHPDTPPVADPGAWEPEYVRASNAERGV